MTLRTARIEDFAVVADGFEDRTLLAAGSISKAVTALLALLLVDGAVVMCELDNGFPDVLPALARALAAAPVR
jgi:hypothetical protein